MAKKEQAIVKQTTDISQKQTPNIGQFMALVERTNTDKPEESHLIELRQMLREQPELWSKAGDLANQAGLHLINSIKGSAALKECLLVGWQEKLNEFGYQQAPLLEKLQIELIVLCWMRLYLMEYHYTSAISDENTLRQDMFWQKRLSAAHHRFRSACESLERVRRLSRNSPMVQVNIANEGGQQVNLAANHSG